MFKQFSDEKILMFKRFTLTTQPSFEFLKLFFVENRYYKGCELNLKLQHRMWGKS